jgi:hypothetical protein
MFGVEHNFQQYFSYIMATSFLIAGLLLVFFALLAAASDKVYQLLGHGRWFSLSTPASSTTKTGRHDIAEILLKVVFNTKHKIK